MHSTMKQRIGCCLTLLDAPQFEDRRPGLDATIWRISLSAALAFKLICDIGHLYPTHELRPRLGAMLEVDGAITLYLWPRFHPDSALLMLLLDYGAARLVDASRWDGQVWMTGDLLCKVIAVLAHRDHWRMAREPRMLRDEVPGWLLSLPQQGRP